MTTPEYREMYAEFCAEGGEQPTAEGYEDFVDWRKRVEAFFKNK